MEQIIVNTKQNKYALEPCCNKLREQLTGNGLIIVTDVIPPAGEQILPSYYIVSMKGYDDRVKINYCPFCGSKLPAINPT